MLNIQIGIKFNDDNYYLTWQAVLLNIYAARTFGAYYTSSFLEDKTKIVEIINLISYPLYMLFQNNSIYNKEDLIEYLKLTEKDILVNNEVDAYCDEIYSIEKDELEDNVYRLYYLNLKTGEFDCR